MPVPGGRLPAPAGEAGAGDRRLAVAGEALQVGAVERVGAGRRHAVGVGPELGAAGACRPSRRRRRRASRTGRPRTCPPAPRRPASSSSATASPTPIATIRASPPRVPDIAPSFARLHMGRQGAGGRISPPPARSAAAAPRLCENDRDGTSDQGPDHREAARRHRPRAAPLDRRARHGALDRDQGRAAGSRSIVSLTTAGCPIRSHFEQAVAQAGLRARRRDRGRGRLRRPLRRGERRPCSRPSAAASCRRAPWPRSKT